MLVCGVLYWLIQDLWACNSRDTLMWRYTDQACDQEKIIHHMDRSTRYWSTISLLSAWLLIAHVLEAKTTWRSSLAFDMTLTDTRLGAESWHDSAVSKQAGKITMDNGQRKMRDLLALCPQRSRAEASAMSARLLHLFLSELHACRRTQSVNVRYWTEMDILVVLFVNLNVD